MSIFNLIYAYFTTEIILKQLLIICIINYYSYIVQSPNSKAAQNKNTIILYEAFTCAGSQVPLVKLKYRHNLLKDIIQLVVERSKKTCKNKLHYYISIIKVAFFLCFIGREHIT